MSPCPFERVLPRQAVRFFLSTLLGFAAGCTSTAPAEKPGAPDDPAAAEASALPPEKDRARVEVEGGLGFKVTEVVHIGSDVRADYQQAVVLLQQDRLDDGIALLEQVVERAPGLTAPHVDLGVAYGRTGAYDKAQKSLEAALALAPNHPAALNELGIVYRRAGKFDEARASYERALAVHPSYHLALRNLGVLCDLYLEDLPCALQNYETYTEIVPDDEQVGLWVADIRSRLGVAIQE